MMPMSIVEELNQKTLAYWKLSSIWNRRIQVDVETGTALEICSEVLETTNYHRPIAKRFDSLLDELIKGEGRILPPAKLLEFRSIRGVTL